MPFFLFLREVGGMCRDFGGLLGKNVGKQRLVYAFMFLGASFTE